MKSIEQFVLGAALDFLKRGEAGWLCTVVQTFGASPRPLGSMMAMNAEGAVVGSLSGGCIEDELLAKLHKGALASQLPEILEYGVSAEENERFGLPCGGRMQILIEPIFATSDRCDNLQALCDALADRRAMRRQVDLQSGQWQLEHVESCQPLALTHDTLTQDFGPRYCLLLVGANELARCISEIALAMDYRVVVCDPREDRREHWSVSGAELCGLMPDEAVSQFSDPFTAVITLTHDPRIDDMALMQALTEPLFYVGALGSERTSQKRRQRLKQLDLSDKQIGRLYAPVGLAIGSKSAMEIAVAVMAQLTQLRASIQSGKGGVRV
ncbi:putative xanthine dehydrogenase subunit A [Zhongshania aliphaticivorans]|uniref:Putative xanthine dehydrogenase subunit A n=1 Tax=Zhongshania aliphaticivorans TaxID=1470434 RepID=A0A5S9QBM3_9GAMM|nr:XdhC family protein [Zhongshania aliphaticivorans]CAA0087851.1 putative xanthine dehydrogenase subunit A [Zhongshania aliphaticivorans]CAA0115544.1 putative xanthine dehydrogenase subunit A [Zhongshania aliphaticivorans]CAA0120254.1 putative xanthine dehydrogenase subunit A [Zhongshania aliphaticivorans]